jgi:hypothetical protein
MLFDEENVKSVLSVGGFDTEKIYIMDSNNMINVINS